MREFPLDGSVRYEQRFAWLPIKVRGRWRWFSAYTRKLKFRQWYGDRRNVAFGEWLDEETREFVRYEK